MIKSRLSTNRGNYLILAWPKSKWEIRSKITSKTRPDWTNWNQKMFENRSDSSSSSPLLSRMSCTSCSNPNKQNNESFDQHIKEVENDLELCEQLFLSSRNTRIIFLWIYANVYYICWRWSVYAFILPDSYEQSPFLICVFCLNVQGFKR